jgi:lipopolysaccharide export system protein LptA
MLLSTGCPDRERTDPDSAEWTEIEARASTPDPVPAAGAAESGGSVTDTGLDEVFTALAKQLSGMKTVDRQSGQTLLTGDQLAFDYRARFVRMDGEVLVDDDRGRLHADSLIGRFSASNSVEQIEAKGSVTVDADGRHALADEATYNYLEGTVLMEGRASLSEEGNSLSGERIQFWLNGERRMICEPNAVLLVAGQSEIGIEEMPEGIGDTEIRASRIVYDQGAKRADLVGNVRLRNPQVAMNCNEIRLFLQDDNKIDWIEALGDVIIQSDERKALADRATYHADEAKFILEGQPPMITMGRNVMTGDRITFWHKTRVVLCEPNGRVLYYSELDDEVRTKFPKDLND